MRRATLLAMWMAGWCLIANGQTPPEVIENSVKIKLVKIPAGEFEMGFKGNEVATSHSQPIRRVKITKPFFLGVHEVSKAQWKAVMGPAAAAAAPDDNLPQAANWGSASEFCKKLSTLPEEVKAGRVYRLPTEAEWEYACRAGTKTLYSFGDDWKKLDEHGWYVNNSQNKANPVGTKKPNPFGLHDMHGNVWEWCSDWFGKYDPAATTDPQGPAEGTERVIRGGSFKHSGGYGQSAARGSDLPAGNYDYAGLRIAMTSPLPLVPKSFASAASAAGAIAADGTVTVTGPLMKDTYTLKAVAPPVGRIKAIRLEVLTDPSLPGQGPGRAPTAMPPGNFVLTGFSLSFGPPGGADTPTAVKFAAARASAEAPGAAIAMAIDDKPETGWAIAAAAGKPQVATFDLPADVMIADNVPLTIVLDQQFADPKGDPQPIGKFRLFLVPDDAPPAVAAK